MENPIALLTKIIRDPIELASITFPSAALVVLLFSYRQEVHPSLVNLPDPLSGNIYGGLLFIVITLVVSLILKSLSHDILNWIYDAFYRDRKRERLDTWYDRAQKTATLTNDPLLSRYDEALKALVKNSNPIVPQVESIQVQSKLARSMSLILLLFAVILVVRANYLLFTVCIALSVYMLYVFFKERWKASELVYQSRLEELSAQNHGDSKVTNNPPFQV